MKVFFLASPAGFGQYKQNYQEIGEAIESFGHKHTYDFILCFNETFFQLPKNKWPDHYKKAVSSLQRADVAVFEVTVSSLAIGQLLQQAILLGKPVIALHTQAYNPIFLGGAEDIESRLQVLEYSLENVREVVKDALDYAQVWLDFRFTMILDSEIKIHLDKVTENGINRSEYIRNLIKKDMEGK